MNSTEIFQSKTPIQSTNLNQSIEFKDLKSIINENKNVKTPNESSMNIPSNLKHYTPPISNTTINPYYAQIIKKSQSSRKVNFKPKKIRKLINDIRDNIILIKNQNIEYPYAPRAHEYYLKEISNNVKDVSRDLKSNNITKNTNEKINKIRRNFEQLDYMYNTLEKEIHENLKIKEDTQNIIKGIKETQDSLEYSQKVVAIKIDVPISSIEGYSYYPNFEKRFNELSHNLNLSNNEFNNWSHHDVNLATKDAYEFINCLINSNHNECEKETHKNFIISTIDTLDILRENLKNAQNNIVHEKDSLDWYLKENKIQKKETALIYLNKYKDINTNQLDYKIKHVHSLIEICKGLENIIDVKKEPQKLSDKLTGISDKLKEKQTPNPTKNKQNDLER